MCQYTKGECTMDAIYVAEACFRGEQMNWCSYLLSELFEACDYVYQ